MLEGFVGAGSTPRVIMSSNSSGASAAIASSTSMACGRTSYCTSIRDSASAATDSLIAATAATAWPSYRTFSRAMMLRVTCQKFTATRSGPMYSNFCSGKSCAVTTVRTPGSAAARDVSMERTRAWACGERRILPTRVPGIFMSAPYIARPVTLGTPSGRTGLVPTHLKPLRASVTFT